MVLRAVVVLLVLLVLLMLSELQGPPLLELTSALIAWFRYVAAWRGVRRPTEVRQRDL
jgi:hypothetical protein